MTTRLPIAAHSVSSVCGMETSPTSFELFLVAGGVGGQPEKLGAATFVEQRALEAQDIERTARLATGSPGGAEAVP
jgi:hypothetical protein